MTEFGYLRDPVGNIPLDLDFGSGLKPYLTGVTRGDVDLSKYATESDQRSLSSCAGNATADSVEILCAIEEEKKSLATGRAPRPIPQLSRLFVYSMARALQDCDNNGQGDLNLDKGTFIRLCFEVLSRFGICEEEVWPYLESKVFTPPSIKALRQATGHKIHSYYRIKQEGVDRIPEVVAALRSNHPVVFGTLIDNSFQSSAGPSKITIPTGSIIGGHAMLIVGYVDGFFKVKNSWGSSWREGGYCYFTPEYLAWSQTWDVWVPTMGTVFGT